MNGYDSAREQRLGIMGGMFDPVHLGHMAFARQAHAACALDHLYLVPCGRPVHRGPALATCEQRIRMLELARAAAWMTVDPRECERGAPSWTYDTLTAYRSEHPGAVLFLLLGLDAFLAFDTWHRWRDLFGLAHLVVAARHGLTLAPGHMSEALWAETQGRLVVEGEAGLAGRAGCILLSTTDLPRVSSTEVRECLRKGAGAGALLHPAVHAFIRQHQLYQ